MTEEDLTYERPLTPAEIEERTALHLELAKQHAQNLADVGVRRREIRTLNAERRKLEVRSAQVLREITSGKVRESPQTTLALDVSIPDPFSARYPIAQDHVRLRSQLSVALQGVLVPSLERLEQWAADTGIFHALAHWARTELAYMNAKSHPDLILPEREPMPKELAELRMQLGRAKAPRKKARAPRPASGTAVATGQGRRKPAARKGAPAR